MKLFYTPNSPYARKVRVCAIEKGVMDRIELVLAPPRENPPDLHSANPLGKIPALILDDGQTLYDSPVICEYLDGLSESNPLFPKNHIKRVMARKQEALADGLMDAFVARYLEMQRPEQEQSPTWIIRWENAINRSLSALEQSRETLPDGLHIGSLALAVALSPIKYVLMKEDFAEKFPKVNRWMAEYETRESFQQTHPKR